jgi:hypothetical protein
MQRRDFMKGASAACAGSLAGLGPVAKAVAAPAGASDGWVSLFNGRDLTGWYSVLNASGRGAAEKIGLVTVEEGMIHVMGNVDNDAVPEIGYLAPDREFENVHLRLEYKWGVKRFNPRRYTKRDNGILFGLVGQDTVWPTCIEFQIQEGDVGDAYTVGGTRGVQDGHFNALSGGGLTENGWLPADKAFPSPRLSGIPQRAPDPNRVANERAAIRKFKDGDFETLNGWNTVELFWQGDRAAYIINGECVNVISNLERPDPSSPGGFAPLKRGRIALEIEYAETWFRRIEYRSLPAL